MKLSGKKVLVTGGAGFIGSHLCEALLEKKNKVVCVDDFSTGQIGNISELQKNPDFKVVKKDVMDKSFKEELKGIDAVYHYAAIVGVERTLKMPVEVLNVDLLSVEKVLRESFEAGVKKFVFASSSEVYGNPVEIPENEDGHVNAKLPYAVSKLAGEKFLRAYFEKYGMDTTSLRFFNVYGPKQDSTPYGFVAGIFIKQALKNEPITIFGDGSNTRDYVFVKDNIQSAILSAESKKTAGEVLNIGSGKPTTLTDLAETIIELTGSKSEIKYLPPRPNDIRHRFPDTSRMRKLLGFKPQVDLKEGLKRTIEYYKKK